MSEKVSTMYEKWKTKKENMSNYEKYRNRNNFSESPKQFKIQKKTKSALKRQRSEDNNNFDEYSCLKSKKVFKSVKKIEEKNLKMSQEVSEDEKVLKFTINTNKGNYDKFSEKLEKEEWNYLIKNSKIDSFTNLLKQTMKLGKKQEKPLIFYVEEFENCDRKVST